ncbi:MAG: hypothetical protein EBS35_03750 [Bacteroidetes bacterium]|nr:hypothetical protein [Bacteroidota bacterium]
MNIKCIVFSLLFSVSAFAQKDYLTFYIENKTTTDLYGIYVTGTDNDSWGEDILPDEIFEAGTILTVTIPINKATVCEQDIKITFSEDDKNPLIFENIDFCTLDKMILTQKGKTIYYTLDVLEELTFDIENKTKSDMYGVFVNGSKESSWGEDILPDDTFVAGTTITVTIPIFGGTTCKQDIKITFSEDDDNPLVFTKIDFCRLSKMILTESKGKIFYTLE